MSADLRDEFYMTDKSSIPLSSAAVLTFLCWKGDDNNVAWPSKATVAQCTGVSLRMVSTAYADLLKRGVLVADGRTSRGRSTQRVKINLAALQPCADSRVGETQPCSQRHPTLLSASSNPAVTADDRQEIDMDRHKNAWLSPGEGEPDQRNPFARDEPRPLVSRTTQLLAYFDDAMQRAIANGYLGQVVPAVDRPKFIRNMKTWMASGLTLETIQSMIDAFAQSPTRWNRTTARWKDFCSTRTQSWTHAAAGKVSLDGSVEEEVEHQPRTAFGWRAGKKETIVDDEAP